MIYYYIKIIKNRIKYLWWVITIRMFCKDVYPYTKYGKTFKTMGCRRMRYRTCGAYGCPKIKHEMEQSDYGKESER